MEAVVSNHRPFTAANSNRQLRLVSGARMTFYGWMQDTAFPTAAAVNSPASHDQLIVTIGRDRDRQAFAALFAYYAPRVKAYLRRLGADPATADELMQEVMLLVWRRAETFDPTQAAASTWIFAIARNKRVDTLRREQRPEYDPQDPALVPEPEEAADHRIETSQTSERLRAALRELPPEQAELLQMAYFDDKPHSLIASERGLPLGTVKSRLRLAMERLRKALKDDR